MSTPPIGTTGPDCRMTFAYRHTRPVGDSADDDQPLEDKALLSITLVRKTNTWTTHSTLREVTDYTTGWQNYTVHIGQLSTPGYQIMIGGQAIDKVVGYLNMELDDIRFVGCDPFGPVEGHSLSCDFENGTCGWYDWHVGMDKQIDWVN